jgi:hypothetical protein
MMFLGALRWLYPTKAMSTAIEAMIERYFIEA